MFFLHSGFTFADGATEFCLEGELDLGVRYQGTEPDSGELYPTTWCVTTENDSARVFYAANGRSNVDIDGSWAVAYLPPDTVRIIDKNSHEDIEFRGTDNLAEALRVRRIDPRRLVDEIHSSPESLAGAHVVIRDGSVASVLTSTALPLRGQVPVEWIWNWTTREEPNLRLMVDNELLFHASGRWRDVPREEADALWSPTPGAELIDVPGSYWPARVDMQLSELTDGVYIVRGVRSGFQHLVVDTSQGLVVADAPAGWVEFHHIPPSDLVPTLGVSGLSEKFIEFLGGKFPDRQIKAVALTHFHDDHAGGARAFAAAGAEIYASAQSASFIQHALNRTSMPEDRLADGAADVLPVADSVIIGSQPNRVKLMSIGSALHAYDMLGVWALDKGYFFTSDVHIPRSADDAPTEGRATTECWFANWAVLNLPKDVQVVNSHSEPATPVFRLEAYLRSDVCKNRQNDAAP